MGNYRLSKSRSYSAMLAAQGGFGAGAYRFDGLSAWDFATQRTAVGAGVTLSTVQAILPVSQRMAIAKISVYHGALTGAVTFNIGYLVAPTGTTTTAAQTLAVSGNVLFATPPTLQTAGGGVETFVPDVPEAWYDTNGLLVAAVTTVASTGAIAAGLAGVVLLFQALVAPMDTQPEVGTANPNTDF